VTMNLKEANPPISVSTKKCDGLNIKRMHGIKLFRWWMLLCYFTLCSPLKPVLQHNELVKLNSNRFQTANFDLSLLPSLNSLTNKRTQIYFIWIIGYLLVWNLVIKLNIRGNVASNKHLQTNKSLATRSGTIFWRYTSYDTDCKTCELFLDN